MQVAYFRLGRLDESKATIEKALSLKLDAPAFHYALYAIALYQEDAASAQKEEDWARGKPDEGQILSIKGAQAASFGQFRKARELGARSVEIAQSFKILQRAAASITAVAVAESVAGNQAEALQGAAAILRLAPASSMTPGAAPSAAFVLALSGETRQAQAIMDDLDKRFPTNTLLRALDFSMIRSAIELNRGNGEKAIEALQPAKPYERANMAVAYLRGLAYLKTKSSTEASAEFQRILDQPTLTFFGPLGPLAHLGVARAAAIAGDTDRSRKAYQDFFGLWKDADPDIPILKQAKTEYDALPK
jgi:tetratricopeptide (TPR) repeat protein